MIRFGTISAGFVCLTACSAITDFRPTLTSVVAPRPVTPSAAPALTILTTKERLLAAIEGQGCELNATNVEAVLASATITREELLQLTPQLQSEGRIAVSGSGAVRSTSANCINA